MSVVLEAEELYNTEDHLVYTVKTPVIGVTVDIINNLRDQIRITEVSLTGNDEGRELMPAWPAEDGAWTECKWMYPGAVLPGQRFTITLRELRPEEKRDDVPGATCANPAAARRPHERTQPSEPPPPAATQNA